ncbi:predicted protein [Botrytis cinerea T4]|uniref:Uncharacterized protein n=1 Tax=Botryotinia fuckeliana (strain T4) TaxID=999810 RepID=G2Y4N3_BOTF4|nr:predicted protein [Botrytis cinerea T4]
MPAFKQGKIRNEDSTVWQTCNSMLNYGKGPQNAFVGRYVAKLLLRYFQCRPHKNRSDTPDWSIGAN